MTEEAREDDEWVFTAKDLPQGRSSDPCAELKEQLRVVLKELGEANQQLESARRIVADNIGEKAVTYIEGLESRLLRAEEALRAALLRDPELHPVMPGGENVCDCELCEHLRAALSPEGQGEEPKP